PEAAASAAFDAATDAISDLTCPEGTMFSINGCNALCLVCVLLVENSCPPCPIGANDAGVLPCVADCCAEVLLFSDEFGGWGTKAGDVPEVLLFSDELGCALFSDELGCALFSDEFGGWGTKAGDVPEVLLFSDEFGGWGTKAWDDPESVVSDEDGCSGVVAFNPVWRFCNEDCCSPGLDLGDCSEMPLSVLGC